MNRRRPPYAILLQLAFVATLLMALAPLVSRWQQAHADVPQWLMPSGMVHAMPSSGMADDVHAGHDMHAMAANATPSTHQHPQHALPMQDMSMHGMSTHITHASPTSAPTPPASPPLDPHAGHGEACEYCMMASRLMPWLAVLMLLLPALPVIAPIVLRAVATPRSLHWPAHAARGPPVNA